MTSYANVTATLALVVALGGTSYAAIKVTGATVKDGSLSGRDLRNRSVGAVDLRRGVLRNSRAAGAPGPAGPAGPAGPSGPAGPAGERGPSEAFSRFGQVATPLPSNGTTVDDGLALPAGTWFVVASGSFTNIGASEREVACDLVIGSAQRGEARRSVGPEQGEGYALTATADLPAPAEAEIRCSASGANTVVHDQSITAVRVGELK